MHERVQGVYLRNNLPKINDRAYVIYLEQYKSIGTHWVALYVNDDNESASYDKTYFEYVPNEIKEFVGNKNDITNIYKIRAYVQ